MHPAVQDRLRPVAFFANEGVATIEAGQKVDVKSKEPFTRKNAQRARELACLKYSLSLSPVMVPAEMPIASL